MQQLFQGYQLIHFHIKQYFHENRFLWPLSLYKLWSPEGQGWGHKRGNYLYTVYWKECFKMKHQTNFNQTWNKHFLQYWNSNLFKWRFKSSSKGDYHKYRVESFKCFLLMNHSTMKAQIYTSASLYSAESILFNSWFLGVMKVHNRVKHFYICFNEMTKITISNH
jgi:hypothetical protein